MKDKPEPETKTRARPMPPMGPGLFVDRRAEESGRRATSIARAFLKKIDFQSNDADWLEAKMIEVSRVYWAAYDYDNQTSYADIKEELKVAISLLNKTISALDKLSKPARKAVNTVIVTHKRERKMTDYIAEATTSARLIEKAAKSIAAENYVKLPATRFRLTLARLTKLWELLTGSSFKVAKSRAPTQKGKPKEFTNNSNQFAYLVMQAIDENVTAENVSSALQKP